MPDITEYPPGLTKQKRGFSLVWIVPIVAFIITVGMIYKSYIDQGTRIYLTIENGSGIVDGKTPLMYKGIKIGSVQDVHIKEDDVSKLELEVVVDKASSASVAREGNKFWKVEPKISLTEITGLDTIIKGVYIAVMPVATTKEALHALPYQTKFTALDRPPVDVFRPGLALIINTVSKGDISIGAPVFYNKQAIGKVEEKELSDDRLSINLHVRIEDKYKDLIHNQSLFYKMDAIEVKAGLTNVKINMGSFASFIAGGIGVHNSEDALSSNLSKENQSFSLFDSYDEIMLSDEELVLTMQSHHTLSPGMSKLFYKGVEAGKVKDMQYDPKKDQTILRVKLHKKFRNFANAKAYFWIVKPKLNFDGIEGLDTIVKGNYINFISSDLNAVKQTRFKLHEDKPKKEGRHIQLLSSDIQSIKEGAGVFYHNIEIGSVYSYKLNKDNASFSVDLVIKPKYVKLINSSSSFYHNSGVSFTASLDKLSLSTGSMETMLRGGIAVETSRFNNTKAIKKHYTLYPTREDMLKAQYLSSDGVILSLLTEKAGSIKKGSAVFYKQMKAGEVLSTQWDSESKKVKLKIFIIKKYAKEVRTNTLFYNVSGISAKIDLQGLRIETESIETIVAGGISFFTPKGIMLEKAKQNSEFILYKDKEEASNTYFTVKLLATDSSGLQIGSSLKYKNVAIGEVVEINLFDKRVLIHLHVDARHKALINSKTIFWLKGFSFDLDGVKNASAALRGPHITLKPGTSTEQAQRFILMLKPPVPHFEEDGLRIVLKASRRGGVKAGTPIYFRQIVIGSVIEYALNDRATGIDIRAFIQPCFAHLIRKNSYFYNASGIGMDLSLFGAKVKTESLASIITGGIGVLTPDDYEEEAQNEEDFTLNEKFDEDALEWKPELISSRQECQ